MLPLPASRSPQRPLTIPRVSDEVAAAVPWLTVEQMIEVDRAMVEDYGIRLIQMMEHAGRHLAHLARERFLEGRARGRRVIVLAGTGGNGGGALVCARRLAALGANVRVLITSDERYFSEVPSHQLRILGRMRVDASETTGIPAEAPDLIVDGVIGYSLRGAPRGRAAALIHGANESAAPVLALDVPSGLDGTTGAAAEPVTRAAATMTLAMPKQGLRSGLATGLVGELYLALVAALDPPPTRVGVGPPQRWPTFGLRR